MPKILVQIIVVAIVFYVVPLLYRLLLFGINFLIPSFRKKHAAYKKICKEIEETGNLELLDSIAADKSTINKYELYYKNNTFHHDLIGEKQWQYYIKIIGILSHYHLELNLSSALSAVRSTNNHLIDYLVDEIEFISKEYYNEDLSKTQKIKKSQNRFNNYLQLRLEYAE